MQPLFRRFTTSLLLVSVLLSAIAPSLYAATPAAMTNAAVHAGTTPAPAQVCTPTDYTATGANADAITADVDAFREVLGEFNAPEPVNRPDGRRQINWDAAPDGISAPNEFPGDFFNFNAAPRARGIEFATDGTQLQLSATEASGVGVEFDNIEPTYSSEFGFFSAERLFAPIGSNIVDVTFYNPAAPEEPALVDGLGVVFTDVDLADVSKLDYYDADDKLIYTVVVPKGVEASESLSFAGATFDASCISRVRITSGNIGLNKGIQDGVAGYDVVAMDDFIFGEPQPVATIAACGAANVYETTGDNPDSVRPTINAYREALGELNPFEPQNFADGRRQINWDAAPDGISAPNSFPGDFFNFNASPRARGIEFTTPGTDFQLSATEASKVGIEFDNINPAYSSIFQTYSPERLFTPIGSNIVRADFFDPATQTEMALTDGFGAVFTDVDLSGVTTIEYLDMNENLLYKQAIQPKAGDEGLSFAGVKFDASCVAYVKLTNGTTALGAKVNDDPDNNVDLVVMDDFIYGEPQPIKEIEEPVVTSCGVATIFETTGYDPDSVRGTINEYREALGQLNAFAPFNNLDGRRQINWDAAPDGISAPNSFPGDFFNADVEPRARGIEFTTPGTDFQLSATEASGAGVEFDNINKSYSSTFGTFSPERLFTPIGSNIVRADFFNPASQTEMALTDGFGAVFTDVDLEGETLIEYFDINEELILSQVVKAAPGDEGLSFAGVKFEQNCVAYVRLTNGTMALGEQVNDDPEKNVDLVVMDDFIYGEPIAVENSCSLPEVYTDVGLDAASIEETVEAYRAALGELNAFEPTNFDGGRRQINWDAAPDAISAPNEFPGNFFNFNAAPRARGIEFTTPGEGFQLSATEASGVGVEFDNINKNASAYFTTFSPERLFTPIGSNEVDAFFFDPAAQTQSALTSGFGAVFTDVDLANVTGLRYYDVDNKLVYAQAVPNFEGNQNGSLSFAGLKFDSACISRVRLINGNTELAKDTSDDPANGADVVVMDDFIYGEPTPAQLQVDAALNIIEVKTEFDRTPQENAEFGVFTINATFQNVGDEPIKGMSFIVSELSNDNALLNSTNGKLGVGASFPIPGTDLGTDEVLAPGESFIVSFDVGVNQFKPFTLLVNAFGSIGDGVSGTVDLGWNYTFDSNPVEASQVDDGERSIYLPVITTSATR